MICVFYKAHKGHHRSRDSDNNRNRIRCPAANCIYQILPFRSLNLKLFLILIFLSSILILKCPLCITRVSRYLLFWLRFLKCAFWSIKWRYLLVLVYGLLEWLRWEYHVKLELIGAFILMSFWLNDCQIIFTDVHFEAVAFVNYV